MSVLVLRLAGPMLSWASESKYRTRHTRTDPTLSAVRGLLSAAAGIGRSQAVPAWIADARIGFRIESPGSVLRDYHTVNPPDLNRYRWMPDRDLKQVGVVAKADGTLHNSPVVTERYYVQDATYTVFVEDTTGLIESALTDPKWTLYAGRKACTLTFPLVLARVVDDIENVISVFPRITANTGQLEGCLFFEPQQHVPVRRESVADRRSGDAFMTATRVYISLNPPLPNDEATP
jgi:CRISPR system Cascade subunit CasD